MRRVRRSCGIVGSVGVGGLGRGDTGVRVEGSGSGSGTCCSWLRGVGAAVVVLQLAEGIGSGSGTCCSWLRGLGAAVVEGTGREREDGAVDSSVKCIGRCFYCMDFYYKRGSGQAQCHTSGCKGCDIRKCQCDCCEKQKLKDRQQRAASQQLPSSSSHVSSSSRVSSTTVGHQVSGLQPSTSPSDSSSSPSPIPYIIAAVALIIVVICVMIYFRIRPFHRTVMIALMINRMSSEVTITPPYSAIAAVIVAIIVAIILLDLCIFRFPVGRNIRDFLVRKIPFCIAFYS
ncbi:hypothetical protein BBBOND_0200060 [Babesia bigemina]|uniref:Uncharacterized protein n=1 Tax=Babesia bigemina TaxID=5866 RepID=A0A061D7I9_BABBI|nr:hypothetical protein BBBOND_0200060 [Babesia bigemina]CDR94849.1 hypothetical protein BBBOND_0200060 [Babesia bigemina]|eukprot:XP_012767035.1 hypothetical protein BBBOND_0200060 [Babesia bigemina]